MLTPNSSRHERRRPCCRPDGYCQVRPSLEARAGRQFEKPLLLISEERGSRRCFLSSLFRHLLLIRWDAMVGSGLSSHGRSSCEQDRCWPLAGPSSRFSLPSPVPAALAHADVFARPPLPPSFVLISFRGCHTYVVREGWEGLVRGNSGASTSTVPPTPNQTTGAPVSRGDGKLEHPLSFGSGELLRYQSLDSPEDEDAAHAAGVEPRGGKYILRVGWDDVRGWLGEVSPNEGGGERRRRTRGAGLSNRGGWRRGTRSPPPSPTRHLPSVVP